MEFTLCVSTVPQVGACVCTNNGSVWQNIFAKKTLLVNYWGFSLNSDGSGAEFGLLVL